MLLDRLDLSIPLIQAPMAGVSTPMLAARVSDAGGLGSIGLGAAGVEDARSMIGELRERTNRAFNVNLFVHALAWTDATKEAAWIAWLAPVFARFGATPPDRLRPAYASLNESPAMVAMLIEVAPPVVSFHFGLPSTDIIAALRAKGVMMLASATSPAEARLIEAAGIDMIVAQGIEAGGHRGMFDPAAPDDEIGTWPLTRMLVQDCNIPVIAAGGIMDGAGIAAAMAIGAVGAQLGTAFIACDESAADADYRAALMRDGAHHTIMTTIVSGRPARSLPNRFTALGGDPNVPSPPDYPIAYDAGKALAAAARAKGECGFSPQWAGQGAPHVRPMSARNLVETLRREFEAACAAKSLPS